MSRAAPPFIARFVRFVPTVAAAVMVMGVVGAGLAACGSTGGGEAIAPITGVTVRAETLTAGRGCGSAPTQLFRYAVVVLGLNAADANRPVSEQRYDEYVASNVYDCFTDGTFVELPALAGSSRYALEVYAYNRAASVALGAAGGGTGLEAITRRLQENRVALLADGGGAPQVEAIRTDLARLRATNPTFSTTCTAEQLGLVQTLAVCKPLQLGLGGIGGKAQEASVVLSLAKFRKSDGTDVACDDQFVTVRTKYRVGNVETSPVDTRCSALVNGTATPVSITIPRAEAPASYVFTATVLRADGATLGTTTCGAETSPGLTSPATCQPLR